MHQVNDALENTDYWFRATITTPEHNVPITKGNYQRCEETFRKQVRAASKRCATSSRGSRASMLAAVRWARAHGPRPMSRHDPRLGRADSRRWATPEQCSGRCYCTRRDCAPLPTPPARGSASATALPSGCGAIHACPRSRRAGDTVPPTSGGGRRSGSGSCRSPPQPRQSRRSLC
jgi:hypothetical protein